MSSVCLSGLQKRDSEDDNLIDLLVLRILLCSRRALEHELDAQRLKHYA